MATIKDRNGKKVAYTVKYNAVISYADGTQATVFNDTTITIADAQAAYNAKVPPIVIPTPPTPPTNPTPPIGYGSASLTIDGAKTKYGQVIIVAPGNYAKITIQNLSDTTVNMEGVILDGGSVTNKDGFDHILTIGGLKNVNITDFLTQNIGYFSGYITGQLNNVIFNGVSYKNCQQGWHTDLKLIWDGTDATLLINGIKWIGCTWDNAPIGDFSSILDGKNVTNLLKNVEIGGNSFKNFDGGELINAAVDYYNLHDNIIDNMDATNTYDIRLFKMIGYGDTNNNKFTNIYGHAIACWSCSYGSVVKTSNYKNTTIDGSRKYAPFEFHEYAAFAVPGKTVKANLIIDGVQADNLDTDGPHTDFPATFIDNYAHINAQDGALGGNVTLLNAHGSKWGTAPKLPVIWNLVKPDLISGCSYGGVAV